MIRSLKDAAKKLRSEIKTAVAEGDYNTFQSLIEGTPLADIITSEADFELFQEAQELREEGDREGAREILDELGFEPRDHNGKRGGQRLHLSSLTDEQREALQVAKEANDRDTVRAILAEAGIERR